jgi:thiosulfate reductase cytochrome b subunit
MKRLEPKHPRAVRWLHWINVPVLCGMIWSGLLIYWANDVYRIGWGGFTLFHFFPEGFYDALHLKFRLAEGMAWHFFLMWLFAVNGILYVGYTAVSGEWRHLLPNRRTLREAVDVVLHDLHLRKGPLPPGKFNAAQRIAYTGVIVMGAGSLLTGLAIYKPVQLSWLTWLLGGYERARWEHFWLTVGYVLFFLIHITQVIRAGWNNFRAMVTGYELVPAGDGAGKQQGRAAAVVTAGDAERAMRRMTRRSFAVGGVAALFGFGCWSWLRTRGHDAGIAWPLRRVHDVNARLAQAYFRPDRLAPTFPPERAREVRVNGGLGLDGNFDPARWKLQVEDVAGNAVRVFSLDAIKAVPRVEMVTEFKCIEGWSEIVRWAGVRLVDFLKAHRLGTRSGKAPDPAGQPQELYDYIYLETPGGGYYVSLDMASALHPQTLLCYEMNGQPLTLEHGAPLRLVIPVKYGIKNLKRIGRIRFLDERPADYWAERGYDWYSGH